MGFDLFAKNDPTWQERYDGDEQFYHRYLKTHDEMLSASSEEVALGLAMRCLGRDGSVVVMPA